MTITLHWWIVPVLTPFVLGLFAIFLPSRTELGPVDRIEHGMMAFAVGMVISIGMILGHYLQF